MRYIAFDIGIKNFAFMVVDFDIQKRELTVRTMHNWNLLEKNQSLKNYTLDKIFFQKFHQRLKEFQEIFNKCDICLMERQLFSKQNYKACTMYHHLYAHLCIFYPCMKLLGFPSKRKYFAPETFNKTYSFRKNWGIEFTIKFLESQKDEVGLDLLGTFKKKDDIADCFLMIYSYVYK